MSREQTAEQVEPVVSVAVVEAAARALVRAGHGAGSASRSTVALERAAGALERRERAPVPDLPVWRRADREYDGLGRQAPRNIFRGRVGVSTLLRMGMGAQFRAHVPAPAWREGGVSCRCGEDVAIEVGEVAECPGGCGRWFLMTETSVRVARWARETESEEAACP